MDNISGLWVSQLYINFIIECEGNELVESGIHLPKMKKNKVDNISHTYQNNKSGRHFTEGVYNNIGACSWGSMRTDENK